MQKSLAVKLGVIAAIAVLLLIPIMLLQGKIVERAYFKRVAKDEIAKSWTGRQRLVTPVLVLGYTQVQPLAGQSGFVTGKSAPGQRSSHQRLVLPEAVSTSGDLKTELRHKGIYRIPVYSADLNISGRFNPAALTEQQQAIAEMPGLVRQEQPFLALMVSDPRGIGEVPTLDWQGKPVSLVPGSGVPGSDTGVRATLPALDDRNGSAGPLQFNLRLNLQGMERLQMVPAALDASFTLQSNWPHPKFEGAYLPGMREVSAAGFTASWRLNQFSTAIKARMNDCAAGRCGALDATAFGVSLIEPVDVYVQADRATKYGMLFVGLSFIAFFMFELMRKLRIHPIQYTLVGLAIALFYLLLLSLSEHISFGLSYFIAALACISLLGYYVRFVLKGIAGTVLFCGMLTTLYALLYVIIQAEDFALLGGSVMVFAVLAIIMMLTRNIDWYALADESAWV
jgi:inner membrane protein